MPSLRSELLSRRYPDGRIEFYDPILQAAHIFSKAEAQYLAQDEQFWPKELRNRLSQCMMLEGLGTEVLRKHFWSNRLMFRIQPDPIKYTAEDWHIATDLPDFLQPQWRKPERWRRLYEHVCAGNDIIVLDEFIDEDALIASLPARDTYQLSQSGVVTAYRSVMDSGLIHTLMQNPIFRRLAQSLLHVPLQEHLWVQAWKLHKGEGFKVHSGGTKYVGALMIGCAEEWTAHKGGAYCFGINTEAGWNSHYRWLPHLGSALLFRPKANLWMGIEEVLQEPCVSITAWWLEHEYQMHHHSH